MEDVFVAGAVRATSPGALVVERDILRGEHVGGQELGVLDEDADIVTQVGERQQLVRFGVTHEWVSLQRAMEGVIPGRAVRPPRRARPGS